MHSGAERRVHVEVTWFSVCCAFDFGYATELVIVTQLFVLASARYDQKSLAIKVLMRRSKPFCYAAHIFPVGEQLVFQNLKRGATYNDEAKRQAALRWLSERDRTAQLAWFAFFAAIAGVMISILVY